MFAVESLTLAEVLGWIRDLGTIGVLGVIVYGAINEWWVPGISHRRLREDCDEQIARVAAERDVQFRRIIEERNDQMRRIIAERDQFREELFDSLRLASRATQVARRATDVAFEREAERDSDYGDRRGNPSRDPRGGT